MMPVQGVPAPPNPQPMARIQLPMVHLIRHRLGQAGCGVTVVMQLPKGRGGQGRQGSLTGWLLMRGGE